MLKEELENIVKERINYKENYTCKCCNMSSDETYDALDMTGYNDFNNFELIGRFSDLMFKSKEEQNCTLIIPRFHKGSCNFQALNCGGKMDCGEEILERDWYSESTLDILMKTITLNNPTLLLESPSCPDCGFIYGNNECGFCKVR